MRKLTKLIMDDMCPALGVTEPGAIAYAVSKAKSYMKGKLVKVTVYLNSGMYKNAFTCGIPNSKEVGNLYAAALGVISGNPEKGLEALMDVSPEDNIQAKEYIEQGKIIVNMEDISSRIYIKAVVETDKGMAQVTIRDNHTNVCEIKVNGETIFSQPSPKPQETDKDNSCIHQYTLAELLQYVDEESIEDIQFIKEAYRVNKELFQLGLESERTTFAPCLYKENGGKIISESPLKTAQLLCSTALEARVIGLEKPAMSITGSGAHGIIATMPLYAYCQVKGISEEKLLRATQLSYFICTYIKEYSGRLSAFCGCAIAAGTGMACGLVYLQGGGVPEMTLAINNMASSITGMICDGGNQGCTMKGIVAVDTAFRAFELAMRGVGVDPVHGINGKTPEQTMKNMGRIASPGMVQTEKTIIDILEEKQKA